LGFALIEVHGNMEVEKVENVETEKVKKKSAQKGSDWDEKLVDLLLVRWNALEIA
jgi:hypothetical protein